MTTKVYEVSFKEYWDYDRNYGNQDTFSVSAKDGETAIAKVKYFVLKRSFVNDETGKTHNVVKFELVELKKISELDL